MKKPWQKKNCHRKRRNWFIGISLNATYPSLGGCGDNRWICSSFFWPGLSHWDGRKWRDAYDSISSNLLMVGISGECGHGISLISAHILHTRKRLGGIEGRRERIWNCQNGNEWRWNTALKKEKPNTTRCKGKHSATSKYIIWLVNTAGNSITVKPLLWTTNRRNGSVRWAKWHVAKWKQTESLWQKPRQPAILRPFLARNFLQVTLFSFHVN